VAWDDSFHTSAGQTTSALRRLLAYCVRVQTAVVIPALNEADSLRDLLPELVGVLPSARVVVVDNGSSDRTAEVAASGGAQVVFEPRRGYGSACLAGIRALRADPPDVLVILDADHADDPAFLPNFLDRIGQGVDLVVSTRTQGGAEDGALTPVQIWGNRLQTVALRMRFGLLLTDMGPMRAIRWTSLESLEMEDLTWGWNIEMACKAARVGLRIEEVPVTYRCRQEGVSKISGSVSGAARAGVKILYALGKYGR
jgi:glycosyltransferase involved in cell wall biosynthesis